MPAKKKAHKRKTPAKKAARKRGRPTIYSAKLADAICQRIAGGELMKNICAEARMPDASTVYRWSRSNDEFRTALVRAREDRIEYWLDLAIELAETLINEAHGAPGTGEAGARVNAVRERINLYKWRAEKEKAALYGSLLKLGDPEGRPLPAPRPEIDEETMRKLIAIREARGRVEGQREAKA